MQKVKKYWKAIIVVLILGAIAGIGTTAGLQDGSQKTAPVKTDKTAATLSQTSVTYTAKKGDTALAGLQNVASVTTKDSAYGAYVDSINGLEAGTDGKYWAFYIDGKLATAGAGLYIAKGGELIEWKFEK